MSSHVSELDGLHPNSSRPTSKATQAESRPLASDVELPKKKKKKKLSCSFQFRFPAVGSWVNDLTLWASVSLSLKEDEEAYH